MQAQQPFQFQYTPSVADLLKQLNSSLALSTYQAGKVIFISAQDNNKLVQLPRNFSKAMGIAIHKNKLALACKEEIIVFSNSRSLAQHYPNNPKTYDTMFLPRCTYYTGAVDIHDIDFTNEDLCAVNTNFSCIVRIDDNFSFTPIWKPNFITKATAGDHCHLNGMAVNPEGEIKYVTAFAQTDTPRGWTADLTNTGVLIDYQSKQVLIDNLAMPHSPRIYNGDLYLLQSANGTLIKINRETLEQELVYQYDGFLRGLSIYRGYAFIGLSKIRKESSSFGKLAIAKSSKQAGIHIVELKTGARIGQLVYTNSVDELYDIQILPNMQRPSILNTMKEVHRLALSLPNTSYWGKKNA